MITFLDFVSSFIECKVPDELILEDIRIDHRREEILVKGHYYDTHGDKLAGDYIVPFVKDADYEQGNDNNAEQPIVTDK